MSTVSIELFNVNIKALADRISIVKWKVIPRSANKCANWIAKQARLGVRINNWVLEPPPQLRILLAFDCNNDPMSSDSHVLDVLSFSSR